MVKSIHASCLDQIPPVEDVRGELTRNVREKDLLEKLLKLAERKATLLSCSGPKQAGGCNER